MTLTVVVPAHNEAATIGVCLASLAGQTVPPTAVVVVADNCTDATAEVARAAGARVVVTVDNADKKAGALNQALAGLLPTLQPTDVVMVMDADSWVDPVFLAVALQALARPGVGAVGGVFYGESGNGLIGALQRSEYARYAREIARRGGRATVLTGTATVATAAVLGQVAGARGLTLPGRAGYVYDTNALTEDNELTLAVKTLGWRAVSPRECRVTTEVMPTWSALWHQRLRWQRGAVENLRTYGCTRTTMPYIAKQATMHLGIAAVALFMAATALFGVLGLLSAPVGWWWALPALFVTERVVTVRGQGWRAMVLAAPIVVEFAYDVFQQAIYVVAAWHIITGRDATWHHANAAQP